MERVVGFRPFAYHLGQCKSSESWKKVLVFGYPITVMGQRQVSYHSAKEGKQHANGFWS